MSLNYSVVFGKTKSFGAELLMKQIPFNKQFGLDPEKMRVVIKMIFLFIKANQRLDIKEIERVLLEQVK